MSRTNQVKLLGWGGSGVGGLVDQRGPRRDRIHPESLRIPNHATASTAQTATPTATKIASTHPGRSSATTFAPIIPPRTQTTLGSGGVRQGYSVKVVSGALLTLVVLVGGFVVSVIGWAVWDWINGDDPW